MRKWIFCCALLLCLSAFALPCFATSTPPEIPTEGDVWDGSIEQPTKIVQKDGVNYYEITKCSQLAYVAQTGGQWLNANYILGDNLFFNSEIIEWDEYGNLISSPDRLNEWLPIGNQNNYFKGKFLGNGYLISGIYIGSGSEIGLFSSLDDEGVIDGITLVNSYIIGTDTVGGIVGDNQGGEIANCNNYSCIVSALGPAGGICGKSRSTSYHSNAIWNCTNYGNLCSASSNVGGIIGKSSRDDVMNCANYGNIYATKSYIGGIVGCADTYPEILSCVNYGMVSGSSYIGGICGQATGETYLVKCISDCYNTGNVSGTEYIGGIMGNALSCKVDNCYSLGNISGNSGVGAVVGFTDSLFGKSEERNNYYLDGSAMSGRGNTEDATDAVEKKSVAVLKDKATYHNWAFDTIWGISPALNSGYPYLLWQDVSEIPLTGVTFARAVVSLSVGDTLYLTAQQQPATAEMPALTWGSSDEEVATVNTNGRVTAVGVGTATITVSGGGFSATCAVTVKPRAADEYRIGALTVRDANGAALDAIPHGTFLVTVPVTKQYDGGNSLVFLAAYSASDQFRGLLYVEVEDIPLGTTIKITLPVDNTNGEIAQLKAFTIASFSNPIPLGAAVSFSAQ